MHGMLPHTGFSSQESVHMTPDNTMSYDMAPHGPFHLSLHYKTPCCLILQGIVKTKQVLKYCHSVLHKQLYHPLTSIQNL